MSALFRPPHENASSGWHVTWTFCRGAAVLSRRLPRVRPESYDAGSVNPQFQIATVKVLGRGTAATRPLPRRWVREEEWYNFRTNPRDTVRVLAEVDERTYDPRGYSIPGGSPGMGRHHPISWCQPYDGGRAFYTAMGHKPEYYSEPLLLAHLLGGIQMAAGVARFNCGRED